MCEPGEIGLRNKFNTVQAQRVLKFRDGQEVYPPTLFTLCGSVRSVNKTLIVNPICAEMAIALALVRI